MLQAAAEAYLATRPGDDYERFGACVDALTQALERPQGRFVAQALSARQRGVPGAPAATDARTQRPMATDDTAGQDSKGIWLWTLFSTVTLFFLEFILFAAFIPSDWARQVSETETRWLVETQGPASAQAIIDQAEGWYRGLFVETGIAPWTYHILAPGRRSRPSTAGRAWRKTPCGTGPVGG